MPGPMGGGGRGGSFGGGSRGGGSFGGGRGGSFGGGMHHGPMHHGHHHHHHHFHRPFFFGPRFFHRPGGFFGGGGAIISAIIFIVIFSLIWMMPVGGSITVDSNSNIVYDQGMFEAYAESQYFEVFSETENLEENILIVFTVYDGYYRYEYIPYGGWDLDSSVVSLFGSYFSTCVESAINEYYENSLEMDFKDILDKMTSKVSAITGAPDEDFDSSYSKLYNHSDILQIDAATVNKALVDFAESTGYNIAIVVEDGEDIFGVTESSFVWVMGIVIAAIVIVIIVGITKNKSKGGSSGATNSQSDKTNPDAGQGKYDPNTGTWV